LSISYALRDRAVLVAEHRALVAAERVAKAPEFRRFLAGARAGLDWVLGRAATAPATGSTEPPTVAQLEREERFCDEAIYSPLPRPALDPDYANGVEHALSWARGAESEPPTPLDGKAQPARAVCTCG